MCSNPNHLHELNLVVIEPDDFEILAKDEEQNSTTRYRYKICNVGRDVVYVHLLEDMWQSREKLVEDYIVKPGQTITFDYAGEYFHASGIRIINKSSMRALVYRTRTDDIPLVVPRQLHSVSKELDKTLNHAFSIEVRYTPYIRERYNGLFKTFWPSNKPNVWQEMFTKLSQFVSSNIAETMTNIVTDRLETIGKNIHVLSTHVDEGRNVRDLYLEIVQDMLQLKDVFILTEEDASSKTTNMVLLPLFSNYTLMKTTFFTLGLITAFDIGLILSDIKYLKTLLVRTVRSATQYINKMLKDRIDDAYNNLQPENLYDSMMNVRTYISVHGLELSRIWDNILRSPFTGVSLYNDVISYSNFFGRQTPSLVRQATCQTMTPPLTPLYIGFIHNYLTSIQVHLWSKNSSPPKIGGIKLLFSDHSMYMMGTKTEDNREIILNRACITKLKVTGDKAVDSCTFFISDGRELPFGTEEEGTEQEIFELEGHRIVSLFLSSDCKILGGQAANIAVSYRLNCEWE